MNYTFYLKKIGTLSEHWHKHLVNYAVNVLENEHVYKIHPDFGNTTDKLYITPRFYNDNPYLSEFINDKDEGLAKYFDNDHFKYITLQRVEPYSYIYEHTDMDGPYAGQAAFHHKIHFPLITNEYVAYSWRRNAAPTMLGMEERGIYLFNQIVTHNVMNLSRVPRYHLIAQYGIPGVPDSLYNLQDI